MDPKQRQYLEAWKQHMKPILDVSCAACNALGITPTWSDPVPVGQEPLTPMFGQSGSFVSGGAGSPYLVRLTCQETGTVVFFDALHVGVMPQSVYQGSLSSLPALPALPPKP